MDTSITPALENLISVCKDGEEGFRAAAEAVTDPELKTLLEGYSAQRQRFAHELQNQSVAVSNVKPEEHSSAPGAMHRALMKIREALSGHDDHAILAECERGEEFAVTQFRDTIEDAALPDSVRDTVAAQYAEICAALARLRTLRTGEA